MKSVLFTLTGVLLGIFLSAQDLNEGSLSIRTDKQVYQYGDSIHFTIEDESGMLPDGTLIFVACLNELGNLLENGVFVMDNNKACGVLPNRFIKKGPIVLRAYFTSKGKPMHIARSFIRVAADGKVYDHTISEELKPVLINRSYNYADSKLVKYFVIREPFPSKNIQYQIVDKSGQLYEIAKAERVNDSIIRVSEIDLRENGTIRFFLNNEIQYQSYDVIKARSYAPEEGSIWQNDTIIKNVMPFYIAQERNLNAGNNIATTVSLFADGDLPNVTVSTTTKTRMKELEEKYTQSNFFKNQFGMSFDMTTDPSAATSLTIEEFINRKVPGIRVSYLPGTLTPVLSYRMGTIEIWVDESPSSFIPAIWDIAYVKFIKSSIRGLNTNSAGFFNGGGVGVQGTLAIYTKKGDEAFSNASAYHKTVTLPLIGIEPTHICKENSLK